MLFPEEDAPQLKKWIIQRLENTSDADADVLADYVLALLRHDGDKNVVRKLCEEEIPDFLKEDSAVFVRDVFNALENRSYLPGAAVAPSAGLSSATPQARPPQYGNAMGFSNGAQRRSTNGSRKRSYNDRDVEMQDHFGSGGGGSGGDISGRAFKQARRGGMMGPGGRHEHSNRGGRGGFRGQNDHGAQLQPQQSGFPQIPGMATTPTGLPQFDPNNPMSAIMAMQAMGFPMPAMPPFSPQQGGSPSPGLGRGGASNRPRRGRCRDYDQKGFCSRGNTCMYEHKMESTPYTSKTDEYDPSNSSLMIGVENASGGGHGHANGVENPRGGFERGRGRGRGFGGDRGGHNSSRRGGRSEFSSDRPNNDRSNTTIVVESIPEDKFTEEAVREFFSEFGNITEVTMKPYKRLALIKYEDWNGAKSAYSSPKVIFDNRFVKVYWYKSPESLPKPPSDAMENDTQAAATKSAEPEIDIEEFARKQLEVQKAHEEKMRKKLETETQQKELQKRQQELLDRQAEEKKKLMAKLAEKAEKSGTAASPTAENGDAAMSGTSTKESSQTEALKAQLAALEAEAKSLGLDPSASADETYGSGYRGRGRGARGAFRGRASFTPRGFRGGYRGRGAAPFARGGSSMSLDNRPKKIALTGVDLTDSTKDESLRQYLLGIGEFTELEVGSDRSTITFKDRYTAEKFFFGTREIPSVGKLEFSWVQTPLPPVNLEALKAAATAGKEPAATGEDTAMDDGDVAIKQGGPGEEVVQNFDYDVADDNDWDN